MFRCTAMSICNLTAIFSPSTANREEAEKQGNAAVGVAGAFLLGLAGIVGAVIKEVRDSAKKQDDYAWKDRGGLGKVLLLPQ